LAAVQGRLRRLGAGGELTDTIDSTGLVMHRDRRVVARRQGERETEADLVAGSVWGVDGPAPVYLRTALVAAREPRTGGGWEVLDEDFFMYKEDIDLAWRLRLLGWTAWYEPKALAWHARAAGGPDRFVLDLIRADRTVPRWIRAISWRNHRLMQLKNECPSEYLRDLPWILGREILSLGFLTMVDPRLLEAVGRFIQGVPGAFDKRRSIAGTIRRIEAERARA
jgi:GT2 family glycosyltransferase